MTNTERITIQHTIDALLAAGFTLGVYDGEEITISRSTDAAAIMAALNTTDEDYLKVYPAPTPLNSKPAAMGWVMFVYGNEDWVVIADHTTNLTGILQPVSTWVDEQAEMQCNAAR